MTQGAVQRRVSRVTMKVVNPGGIDAQPAAPIHLHLFGNLGLFD